MFTFNFGRKVRRLARRQRRRGKLDSKTYQKIVDGSRDSEMVAKWKVAIESGVSGAPWLQKTGMDWREMIEAIKDWFLENWPAILKILLTLLVFIEPPPKARKSRYFQLRDLTPPPKLKGKKLADEDLEGEDLEDEDLE